MYGAVLGDIIGSPYERHNKNSKDFPLFSRYSRFTDDTVMTLAVAAGFMSVFSDPDSQIYDENYVNDDNKSLVEKAVIRSMKTLGLTGGTGGRLKRICDCAIAVPGECTADMQELHLPIYHALCEMLEAKFFES